MIQLIQPLVYYALGVLAVAAAPAPSDDAGFRPIFDGKSLAGWETVDPSYWSVADGAITATITKDHPLVENRYPAASWRTSS